MRERTVHTPSSRWFVTTVTFAAAPAAADREKAQTPSTKSEGVAATIHWTLRSPLWLAHLHERCPDSGRTEHSRERQRHIGLGVNLFAKSTVPSRTMIALTDGNDTGSSVPPTDAARVARDNKITIHTVAIGDPAAAGEVLDQVEKRKVDTVSFQPRVELFWVPLLALIVLSNAGSGVVDEGMGGRAARGADVSTFIENVHFLRPWALLLVVPAVVLWWFARQAADTTRRWSQVIDPELLKALVVGGTIRSRFGPHDLLLVGWLVAAVAIAGPTWQREPSPFAEGAAPAMIVLKVTPSMSTPDLAPTRLDRARQKIADLLKLRDGMPAGLIAYAGSAHLVLPPTQDAGVVVTMADALSPGIMPRDGDRLADAVILAAKVLRDGGQGGSILVIADTAAPGQADALHQIAGHPPIVFFAMEPPAAVDADANLAAAVSALGAREIATTIDNADIAAIARRLADAPGVPAASEAQRWEEAGYWLVPLVALLGLLWFRRGWVLAT